MTTEENYNGWENWETWCINLWLTNDQATYNQVEEILKEEYEFNFQRAEALEEYTEELIDEKVITDRISTHRVNWKEIVDSFEETIEENKVIE